MNLTLHAWTAPVSFDQLVKGMGGLGTYAGDPRANKFANYISTVCMGALNMVIGMG